MATGTCDKCLLERTKIHIVNQSLWTDFLRSKNNIQLLRKTRALCGHCLPGNCLPVFRPSKNVWQVGEVKSFEWKTSSHLVEFAHQETEQVAITVSPFSDYVRASNLTSVDNNAKTSGLPKGDDTPPPSICSPIKYTPDTKAGDGDSFFAFDEKETQPTDATQTAASCGKENAGFESQAARSVDDSLQEAFQESQLPSDTWLSMFLPLLESDTPFCCQTKDASCGNRDPACGPNELPQSPQKAHTEWKSSEEDCTPLPYIESFQGNLAEDLSKGAKSQSSRTEKDRSVKLSKQRQSKGLKKGTWAPTEDATIYALASSKGPKWTMITKVLPPGRTVNAVKKRYQFISRKMEKLLSLTPSLAKDTDGKEQPGASSASTTVADNSQAAGRILALRANTNPSKWHCNFEYTFGPFHEPEPSTDGTFCERCNLLVPSEQTGRVICAKTRWCESCTKTPPFVSGHVLRKVHDGQAAASSNADTVDNESKHKDGGAPSAGKALQPV